MNLQKLFSCVIVFFILLAATSQAREVIIQEQLTNERLGTIQAIDIGSDTYVSIERLATQLDIPTRKNVQTKTLVLTYNEHQITLTAFNPFVRINATLIQMAADVRYPNGEFFIPLNNLVTALQTAGLRILDFESDSNRLVVRETEPNIVNITTRQIDAGLELVLRTTLDFADSDVEVTEDNEWLYINIKDGLFDNKENLGYEPIPEIFELVPVQLNKTTARLSVHLAPSVNFASARTESKTIILTLESTTNGTSILTDLAKEREKWKIDTIILDPGHGGRDPGAVGPGGLYEKHIVLDIAKAIKAELERRLDVNVILTRDRDVFVPLKGRTEKANVAGGKLFISIHVDANRVKSLRGHTVYFLGPAKTEDAREVAQFENSVIKFEESQSEYDELSNAAFILAANAQNSYNKESQDLAAMLNEELKGASNLKGYGVRQAGFYVLYGASMPNVLIETGFMTNYQDRQNLTKSSYQRSLAKAICNGIIRFKDRYESMTF